MECFQCGRPEWLEELLFSQQFNLNVQIVNVEYLTAESWADDFHLLKSGTRSAKIKKINFMPGFTKKTGGLILVKKFFPKIFPIHLKFLFFLIQRILIFWLQQ